MEERVQKVLARVGVASRRAAEDLIRDRRVTVNGQLAELGTKADPALDAIAVDGKSIPRQARPVYILLNKPAGYVCTRSDPQGRPTVYELVPEIPGLFTVGRLDLETEGLLLLTTDGDWAERLAHPRYNIEREYEAYIRGPIFPDALERLREGIMLEGRLARPVAAYEIEKAGFTSVITVIMVEGRRREVRLLCAGAGLPVKRLVRRRFGQLLLGWLEIGQWRELEPREVAALEAGRQRHNASTLGEGDGMPSRSGVARTRERQRGNSGGAAQRTDRDRRPGSFW